LNRTKFEIVKNAIKDKLENKTEMKMEKRNKVEKENGSGPTRPAHITRGGVWCTVTTDLVGV
jgi:hypothetical protein